MRAKGQIAVQVGSRSRPASAKRPATGRVARDGLAVWRVALTIERSWNQRHGREGMHCLGSQQPRRFGQAFPQWSRL